MTMQMHHLHPSHDDEVSRLKARIAELERMDTEHTLQIAKITGYIHHLEEERRWRKFSEEKPNEKQWIYVFRPNHSQFTTGVEVARWDNGLKIDVEYEVYTHWMPMPSAPKED